MSIPTVVEAYKLADTFYKLGYLFRANVCLDIALEHLNKLRTKTAEIKQVVVMLNRQTKKCLCLKLRVNEKIKRRTIIKIQAL
ncbi:ORF-29 [Catopsilia pomona nucleopolyhedrovirus]|uniref:ORF-29 n=1 Tax=Catopsilia pomona nucleopolyhedrovirus TaxID=1850906 RepID=A0A172WZ95_9ABAC|nr:ORF-29 [Catopsilia pomona nucleopolyhedrovirus]ANF29677.1 ORF-29 [Catopsilia pomona nucleopolyhedrovirus]